MLTIKEIIRQNELNVLNVQLGSVVEIVKNAVDSQAEGIVENVLTKSLILTYVTAVYESSESETIDLIDLAKKTLVDIRDDFNDQLTDCLNELSDEE